MIRYASPRPLVFFLAQTLTWAPATTSQPAAPRANRTVEGSRLQKLVTQYFQTRDDRARAQLTRPIESAFDGSIEAVAEAIRSAKLWERRSSPKGDFSLVLPVGDPVTVTYRLPAGYDPSRRYPVIVCMPDTKAGGDETVALAAYSLGPPVDEFILVSPDRPVGGTFSQPVSNAAGFPDLLHGIRKRFSTDTQRTFLFGFRHGGDAAWVAAIMHAEQFAGAILISSLPPLPYAEQSYPLFLDNVANVSILTAWCAEEDAPPKSRQRLVSAHNALISRIATRHNLPIKGLEFPSSFRMPPQLPADVVTSVLTQRCLRLRPNVSHWFRYPLQGRAAWLRLTAFAGPVWHADQISILPAHDTHRDQYITSVLSSKLGYLGATVSGQSINVQTRRCARIELLFPQHLLDLRQPIIVRCNGVGRYNGLVRPDVRTMLETAYEEWDFQRLVVARLSFDIASDRKSP